jgi:hypothetical protein
MPSAFGTTALAMAITVQLCPYAPLLGRWLRSLVIFPLFDALQTKSWRDDERDIFSIP